MGFLDGAIASNRRRAGLGFCGTLGKLGRAFGVTLINWLAQKFTRLVQVKNIINFKNMEEIQNKQSSSMVEIFVNFFSFMLLWIVATAIGILFFQVINKYIPDPIVRTSYVFRSFNIYAIHYSIASLIVAFPLYIWMLWFWFSSFGGSAEGGKNSSEKIESRLSKWLTYAILLIAAGTIVGDLIVVIFNFLQGELGSRFLLKALSVIVIAGLVFWFYFLERKKIQYKKEISVLPFLTLVVLSSILVILAIVLGFFAGGTPGQERLRKFDLERANNLGQISSAISNFAFENNRLPVDLNEIRNNSRYNYGAIYTDPETQKEYDYKIVKPVTSGVNDSLEYELCATFSISNLNEPESGYPYGYGQWAKHDKGYVCQKQIATLGTKNIKEAPGIPVPPLR